MLKMTASTQSPAHSEYLVNVKFFPENAHLELTVRLYTHSLTPPYCRPFERGETEIQRGKVSLPKIHREQVALLGFEFRHSGNSIHS